MNTENKPRFGIFLSMMFGLPTFEFLSDLTITAEKHDFDSVWVPDHLFSSPQWAQLYGGDPSKLGLLDPWITLAALSARTQRIQVGTLVTPITLRHPGLLAKMAATVDNISSGRLILGLGAGWNEDEFNSYNIQWDIFKTRMKKLNEGIELIKKLWVEDKPIDFIGEYYQVNKAHFWPKPIRKPHPPIYLGGSSKSILRAVGKTGDGWVPYQPTIENYVEKMKQIRKFAKLYGRVGDKIVGAPIFQCVIAEKKEKAETAAKGLKWPSVELFDMAMIGSPVDCIEKIDVYLKAGVNNFILVFPIMKNAKNSVIMFSDKVMSYYQ